MIMQHNYPLSDLNTFKIGGAAKYYTCVKTKQELKQALVLSKKEGLRIFVLGNGSNIVISDKGFDGLVIHNQIKGQNIKETGDEIYIDTGAGEDWDEFTKICAQKGWQGIENLSGIPGTIGGACVQNIGAYGQTLSNVIVGVTAINKDSDEEIKLKNSDCGFGYRNSIFNKPDNDLVIISITIKLQKNSQANLSYPDLKSKFTNNPNPTLKKIRKAVIEIRQNKGMILSPECEYGCAGSFFKNPVIPCEKFGVLKTKLAGDKKWYWDDSENKVKISAAYLIQNAGFEKGYKKEHVGISPNHTLALVTYRGATAAELVSFAEKVQYKVKEKFAILLEPEVQFIGFNNKNLCLFGK